MAGSSSVSPGTLARARRGGSRPSVVGRPGGAAGAQEAAAGRLQGLQANPAASKALLGCREAGGAPPAEGLGTLPLLPRVWQPLTGPQGTRRGWGSCSRALE